MIKAVIVDDDIFTLNGLERSLPWAEYGIEVAGTAMDGREGLALIQQHQPQLILTDLHMPVLNGIEMLQQLRSEGNDAEVIILSGYEDFKFAQSAVKLRVSDYLSKPATIDEISSVLRTAAEKIRARQKTTQEEQELRELLDEHLPQTRQLVLKGLLEPHFSESAFFRKAVEQSRLQLDNGSFTVVLLEYVVTRERLDVKRSDMEKFTYAVKNIVDELTGSRRDVYLADAQQNVMALIVSLPPEIRHEHSRTRIRILAGEIAGTVSSYLKLQVWAAVGATVGSVHHIYKSYQQALNLLAERESVRVGDNDSLVLMEEDWPSMQTDGVQFVRRPMEQYQQLISAVTDGQSEQVEVAMEGLVELLQSQSIKPSVASLREMAMQLTGMLTLGLYNQGVLLEEAVPELQLYKEMERISSLADFRHWLEAVMMPVSMEMSSKGLHKHKKTVDYMKRYVQAHYDEEITLDIIAEKVFLTRNYLSQIFKQVTGENFNNYVTRIRMEKAKELLVSGKYKLYEVALMVGYKNNAYFSQQFKKYAGCNPSDFA